MNSLTEICNKISILYNEIAEIEDKLNTKEGELIFLTSSLEGSILVIDDDEYEISHIDPARNNFVLNSEGNTMKIMSFSELDDKIVRIQNYWSWK